MTGRLARNSSLAQPEAQGAKPAEGCGDTPQLSPHQGARRLVGFKSRRKADSPNGEKNGATLVEYGYNPTGTRRYASDSTLGVTNYFCSGKHVLADYTSNWSMVTSYIPGIIAMIEQTGQSDPPPTYYFVKDKLGSTRELVNGGQNVVTRYDYDVWGASGQTQLIGSITTRYRFQGYVDDSSSALWENVHRWYSPEEGRHVSSAMALAGGPRIGLKSHFYGAGPALVSVVDYVNCLDYCTRQERGHCMHECLFNHNCQFSWTMGPCARCCQCWGKRCYMGCKDPFGPPPPDWGDNSCSATKCPQRFCGRPDISVPVCTLPDEEDAYLRDDQTTAENVCASAIGVHKEWNWLWWVNPIPLIEFPRYWLVLGHSMHIGRFCKVCAYQATLLNWPPGFGGREAPGFLRIKVDEQCPPVFPKKMRMTHHDLYFPIVYGEYGAWNSCWHPEIWQWTQRIYMSPHPASNTGGGDFVERP